MKYPLQITNRTSWITWIGLMFTMAIFALTPLSTNAAIIYFGASNEEQRTGSAWVAGIFVDSQGVKVNAVEGEVEFDASRWSVEAVETGSSSITLWIESPSLPETCTNVCRIPFRGVIPGGLMGGRLELFRLVGRSTRSGSVTMTALHARILAHDGQGTALPVTVAPLTIRVATSSASEPYLLPSDVDPPETFTVEVTRDPLMFDGKWFAVFETQDKGSGMARYEWQEASGEPVASAWKRAERPQVLDDQSRTKRVFVRAIDQRGNIRLATEALPAPIGFVRPRNVLFLVGVLIILLLLWSRSRARTLKGGA